MTICDFLTASILDSMRTSVLLILAQTPTESKVLCGKFFLNGKNLHIVDRVSKKMAKTLI